MAPVPTTRAADHDREHVARLLGEHLVAGRLNADEHEERVAAAYTATTLGDLDALLHDLPGDADLGRRAEPTTMPEPSRPSPVRTARADPWARWALVGVISLVIWSATSLANGGAMYFWPMWVIGPWGLALLAHVRTSRRTCLTR